MYGLPFDQKSSFGGRYLQAASVTGLFTTRARGTVEEACCVLRLCLQLLFLPQMPSSKRVKVFSSKRLLVSSSLQLLSIPQASARSHLATAPERTRGLLSCNLTLLPFFMPFCPPSSSAPTRASGRRSLRESPVGQTRNESLPKPVRGPYPSPPPTCEPMICHLLLADPPCGKFFAALWEFDVQFHVAREFDVQCQCDSRALS